MTDLPMTGGPTTHGPARPHEPAWRRATEPEARTPVSIAILLAIGLQVVVPKRLGMEPAVRGALAGLEVALLVGIIAANPMRMGRRSLWLRRASIALTGAISLGNAVAAARLIDELVQGRFGQTAGPLLASGAAVWATNVLCFALWYWELDRGGAIARARGGACYPDLLFPQMTSPEMAPPDWEPTFIDYLFTSFTNATAFSPTDVLPLTAWAKLTFMLQSAVSLSTVGLVIARAVNILG